MYLVLVHFEHIILFLNLIASGKHFVNTKYASKILFLSIYFLYAKSVQ